MIKTSFIFPVFNEAVILKKQINYFIETLPKTTLPYEIILIENGSTDRSWKIIKALQRKHPNIQALKLTQASYGQAVKNGILQAKGKCIFVLNIDFFDQCFIDRASRLLRTLDIVIASKTLPASQDQRGFPRNMLTYLFNQLVKIIFNYPGTDTHGIKAFNNTTQLRNIIHSCFSKDHLLDTEILIRANIQKLNFVELPIHIQEIRHTRFNPIHRFTSTCHDLFRLLLAKLTTMRFSPQITVADDYGLSNHVNHIIIEQAKNNYFEYISIIPNLVSSRAIYDLFFLPSKVKLSIHLNLVEGKPISTPQTIPSIINKHNNFYPAWILLLKLILGKVNLQHVKIELNQQLKYLESKNLKILHLDSHQHLHLFPPIWNIAQQLLKVHNISETRSLSSTRHRLLKKPLKYLAFLFLFHLLSVKYTKPIYTKTIEENIIHPGTNYD